MKWGDIKVGHKFIDGSYVEEKHLRHAEECIELFYSDRSMVVSENHIFLCDVSENTDDIKKYIYEQVIAGSVPLKEEAEIRLTFKVTDEQTRDIENFLRSGTFGKNIIEVNDFSENHYEVYKIKFKDKTWTEAFVTRRPVELESQIVNNHTFWLPAVGIASLLDKGVKISSGGNFFNSYKKAGRRQCFCVSTDTGRYELNGLISHNSVVLTTAIFSRLEHNNQYSVALIDIKGTEFPFYNGMNGVVAVAHSVREAAEVLRISRKIMYKRNKEMREKGIVGLHKYIPTDKSNRVWVTGREYYETDHIKIRIDGEEKTETPKFLWEFLQNGDEAEVCLNGEDWVPVNKYCVDYIYNDGFPGLFIVVDELAELTLKSKVKTGEEKELDEMRDEILSIIQSITQLGRSARINMLLATQKPSAEVFSTTIRANPLDVNTEVALA